MSDPQQAQSSGGSSTGLTIPDDVQQKFGPMIELIKGSESMNNEERQYWINILPIMTPEQTKNLEEILTNEKKQLKAIDEKYSKEISTLGDDKVIEQMEMKIKEKRRQRAEMERKASEAEVQNEQALLQKIQES